MVSIERLHPLTLTSREREVRVLILAGCTNKDLSNTLRISLPTAKFHCGNVLRKLGVETKLQLVAQALGKLRTGAM